MNTASNLSPPPPRALFALILILGTSGGLKAVAPAAQNLPPCFPTNGVQTYLWSQYFSALGVGDVAVILAGDVVYLDVTPPDLSFLEIRGTLVWDQCSGAHQLNAAAVLVWGAGVFQVGTAQDPFPNSAVITLIDWPRGTPPEDVSFFSPEVSGALLDRGLVVCNGGTLRIHGKDQGSTWTRLNGTAGAGATSITVADSALPWTAGQEIVIASTDFDQDQAEVHEILAPNLAVIGLTPGSALAHMHYGQGQNFDPLSMGDPAWNVEERAEVGLLSRNVVIQGEKDAGALNSPEHYGHVFFCKDGGASPTIELDWASFQNLGVGGVIGRYPVHFHQIGTPTTPLFLRDCTVRNTWNRGIVLHDTQEVDILRNVVHNTIGYGIYVETPATIDNHLIGNLVLSNHVYENPQSGAVFDTDPGNLVLKSLQNQVVGNVAAGSEQYGIYYQLSIASTHDLQFFEFSGKVAHSSGKIGIFLNDAIKTDGEPTFLNSAVWKVREHGMWIRSLSGYLVDGLIASDCRSGFYPASLGIRAAGEGHQTLINGLFVGETDNQGEPDLLNKPWELYANRSLPQDQPHFPAHELDWDPLNGIEVYDGFVEVDGCRFARFEDRMLPTEPSTLIRRHAAGLTQVAKYTTWINDPRNRVRDLDFDIQSVDRPIWFRTPFDGQNQIAFTTIVDEDNSIGYGSGTDPMILFPNMPFSKHGANTAVFRPDSGSIGLNGYSVPYSDAQYGQLVVELNQNPALFSLENTLWRRVIDPRPSGTPDVGPPWICETVPVGSPLGGNGHYRFPVVLEVGAFTLPAIDVRYYRMEYENITSNFPKNLNIDYRFAEAVDRTVFLEIPYDKGSGTLFAPSDVRFFKENGDDELLQELSDLNALLATTDRQAWTHVSGVLYLKLTSLLPTGSVLPSDTETKWEIRP